MSFLWFILIGLIAGWLAGLIVKGGGFGLILNLIIGVVGSLLGGFLFSLLGLGANNKLGSLITATVGAIVLLLIVQWVSRKQQNKK